MVSNPINPFEYVSILISIILGLGITQILSSFSDLLYHHKKVKFYPPHTVWVLFVLFLHIQDWFVTYQIKDKPAWSLPELVFILLYPITLFIAAKMLLPTNNEEERFDMKVFYFSQFPMIFLLISISILLSILFNIFFLKASQWQQMPLLVFMAATATLSFKKIQNETVHKLFAICILMAVVLSVVLEKSVWVIK
jgi:hypothetical protein